MRLGSCPLGDSRHCMVLALPWALPRNIRPHALRDPPASTPHSSTHRPPLPAGPPATSPYRTWVARRGLVSQLASVPAGTEGPQRDQLLAQNRHRKTHRENKEGLG